MPRHFLLVIVICALIAASAATVMVMLTMAHAGTATPTGPARTARLSGQSDTIVPGQTPKMLSSMKILPFELVDQDGEPVDESIFDGHITIVDFFFTRCPGPCPLMTNELRRIQKVLDGSGVRIVSFSVDADHDDPAILRHYAATNSADLATWTFVTGDSAQVTELVTQGLGFALGEVEPSTDANSDGPNILHPTHFVLVGPDRRVLAIAGLGNAEHIDLLVDGARRLAEGLDGG